MDREENRHEYILYSGGTIEKVRKYFSLSNSGVFWRLGIGIPGRKHAVELRLYIICSLSLHDFLLPVSSLFFI